MTPELQTLVERIDRMERQNRNSKAVALAAVLVAILAAALPFLSSTSAPDRARFSVVEANKFVLRDADGRIAGGIETDAQGARRFVLRSGPASGAAAFVEVRREGDSHLILRGPDGRVRALVAGTTAPSVALAAPGAGTGVALLTQSDGTGSILISDGEGRPRFRAP